jgi:hypothetical protein
MENHHEKNRIETTKHVKHDATDCLGHDEGTKRSQGGEETRGACFFINLALFICFA